MKKLLILLGTIALTATLSMAEGKCAAGKCGEGKCGEGNKTEKKCDNGKKCDGGKQSDKKVPEKGK